MLPLIAGPIRVFLSYTGRESEVRAIQPFVDAYCRELWDLARLHGLDIFYDSFSLEPRTYEHLELANRLNEAIERADMFTAFLSPAYLRSPWCLYEFERASQRLKGRPAAVLSRDDPPSIQIHTIYWKPTVERWATPAPLEQLRWTDVTFAWEAPERILEAARIAAADSMAVLEYAIRSGAIK